MSLRVSAAAPEQQPPWTWRATGNRRSTGGTTKNCPATVGSRTATSPVTRTLYISNPHVLSLRRYRGGSLPVKVSERGAAVIARLWWRDMTSATTTMGMMSRT